MSDALGSVTGSSSYRDLGSGHKAHPMWEDMTLRTLTRQGAWWWFVKSGMVSHEICMIVSNIDENLK